MGNPFLWWLISQSPHASISTAGIQATLLAWISKTDPRLHAVRRIWPGGSRLLSRWQWGSPSMWVRREVVSGRCHKLGSRVCSSGQVRCLRPYKISAIMGAWQDGQVLNLLSQSCYSPSVRIIKYVLNAMFLRYLMCEYESEKSHFLSPMTATLSRSTRTKTYAWFDFLSMHRLIIFSATPAARSATERSPITTGIGELCMHRNGSPTTFNNELLHWFFTQ